MTSQKQALNYICAEKTLRSDALLEQSALDHTYVTRFTQCFDYINKTQIIGGADTISVFLHGNVTFDSLLVAVLVKFQCKSYTQIQLPID